MNRRRFIYGMMTGTTGLGLEAAPRNLAGRVPRGNRAVTFRVTGFSCVTCATGLEVTLLKQKGVSMAKASYPEGEVVIRFDDRQVSECELGDIILDCGFSAEVQRSIEV